MPLAPDETMLNSGVADVGDRALERASGAPASAGNAVKLLLDAEQNFSAWLDAIRHAERTVFFESYIFADDEVGKAFADALAERARQGVYVCVVYDWLGSSRMRTLTATMRAAGVHVRVFNPPRLDSPLGWFTRDHRKTIAVDGKVAYVSGLCVSQRWLGDSAKSLEPWRDSGIELRGPAVAGIESAFAQVWDVCGEPLPPEHLTPESKMPAMGDARLRVIAGVPSSASTFRLDLVVASMARKRLWLTDAYFVATSAYVQALRAAAKDHVDVRLLVPGASDIPALRPLSHAQYRPLLESGVRVYEWDGTMLHAKTAVADGLWARVGSTNLNLASWMTNYELDVAVEDPAFAETMAKQFEQDLLRTTEIVLTPRNRVRSTDDLGELPSTHSGSARPAVRRAMSGSANRAAAGAVSVGSALGAALTNRRSLGPAEAGLLFIMAAVVVTIGLISALWPRVLAWPLAFLLLWLGVGWALKGIALRRKTHRPLPEPRAPAESPVDGRRQG
ncbi:MAG: phospholipase D-like domain-containing protein [Casimicrobiaceae bacterium]